MTSSSAHRFEPNEVGDLEAADSRVVWATDATASSTWSSLYAPNSACGPPAVYPNGGDEHGTWLAERSDREPWIELTFPAQAVIHGILVCETCGPGAVCEIRDVDRDVVLYEGRPARIADSRSARLFHVPLPAQPGPVRLRLTQKRSGSDPHQIDAVALLTMPLEVIVANPPSKPSRLHRRYAAAEVAQIDVRGDWRISWATSAHASSEYSSRYGADTVVGRPTVFPEAGDRDGTWLSAGDDRGAWLQVEFGDVPSAHGLLVLETCGAGSVVRAMNEYGEVLFQSKREGVEPGEAHLLHIPLEPGLPPTKVRLWVSAAETEYREIDAVALIEVPFAELFEPAPSPPPPPAPGAPAGGFAILEGTLVGVSHGSPFVHATLCTADGGRAANHGGALRLRLDDGAEVPLETGETAVYGGISARRTGSWAEVSAALPSLAAAFAGTVPAGEVLLEGQLLDGDARVWIAGVPRGDARGGFRGGAAPESLVAVAISQGPLTQTSFANDGVNAFSRAALAHRPPPTMPHPLGGAARASAVIASACALAIVADVVVGGGRPTAGGALALYVGLYAAVLALELGGRIAFVPTFLRGPSASLHDRRPAFAPPEMTLLGMGTALVFSAVPLLAGALADWSGGLLCWVSCALVAPVALIRLVLYGRSHAPGFLERLRVARAPAAQPLAGAHGRLTGRLGRGQEFTRTEVAFARSKHLGTDTYTESDGRMIQRDRYSNWVEHDVESSGPSSVRLLVGDTQVVSARAPRTTDVELRSTAPPRGGFSCLMSQHGEGDEATLIGAVRADAGEALQVEATHLVLGDFGVLRRRVLLQLLVFVALVGLVGAGGLASIVLARAI